MNLVVKTLSALLSAMVISMPVFAQHSKPVLDVVVSTGNTGLGWVEGVMIQEALIGLGYDSKIVHTKNCINTNLYIKRNTGRPAVLSRANQETIADNRMGCEITPTPETFITPLYLRLQTICSRKDVTDLDQVFAKNRVTISTSNTTPGNAFHGLGTNTNTTVVRVDYDGNINALKGLIAGDTDLLYTSYTKREINNTEIKCWGVSGTQPVNGMPTLTSVFPNWPYANVSSYKYVHGVNINDPVFAKQIKQDIFKIIESGTKMSAHILDSHMTPGTKLRDHTVEDFQRSVDLMLGK